MDCDGDENSILECGYSKVSSRSNIHEFVSMPVFGVACDGSTTSLTECEEGEMRLVGGEGEGEGRVEVCVEGGFWGTVCGDQFDTRAAFFICRRLGYHITAHK